MIPDPGVHLPAWPYVSGSRTQSGCHSSQSILRARFRFVTAGWLTGSIQHLAPLSLGGTYRYRISPYRLCRWYGGTTPYGCTAVPLQMDHLYRSSGMGGAVPLQESSGASSVGVASQPGRCPDFSGQMTSPRLTRRSSATFTSPLERCTPRATRREIPN